MNKLNPVDWPEAPPQVLWLYPNRGPPGTCMNCGDKIEGMAFTSRCPPCKAMDDEMVARHFMIRGCMNCGGLFIDCCANRKLPPPYRCRYETGHKGPCKPPEGEE